MQGAGFSYRAGRAEIRASAAGRRPVADRERRRCRRSSGHMTPPNGKGRSDVSRRVRQTERREPDRPQARLDRLRPRRRRQDADDRERAGRRPIYRSRQAALRHGDQERGAGADDDADRAVRHVQSRDGHRPQGRRSRRQGTGQADPCLGQRRGRRGRHRAEGDSSRGRSPTSGASSPPIPSGPITPAISTR